MITRKQALLAGTGVLMSAAFLTALLIKNQHAFFLPSSQLAEAKAKSIVHRKWPDQPVSTTSCGCKPVVTTEIEEIPPPPPVAETPAIKPPFPGYEKPMQEFRMRAEEGGTFTYETGSKVTLPAGALLHADGSPVSGEVTISYREYHTMADIYLSGIPMKYDVDGEEAYFESAGMLEIRARQDEEQLTLDPAKPVTLSIVSDNASPDFNLYALNDKTGEWTDKGNPFVVKDRYTYGVTESYQFYREPNLTYSMQVLRNDQLPGGKLYRKKVYFQLWGKSDEKRNETKWFSGRRFEVQDMKRRDFRRLMKNTYGAKVKFLSKGNRIELDNAMISDDAGNGTVTVSIYKDEKELQFTVKVDRMSDKLLERRMKRYNRGVQESRALVKLKKPAVNQTPCYTLDGKDYTGVPGDFSNTWNIVREFTVDGFGFWNSDQPKKLPSGAEFIAMFEADGSELSPHEVQLVDYRKNALFMYHGPSYTAFKINPDARNMIWVAMDESHVACILPDEVKKLNLQAAKVTIPMKVYELEEFMKLMEGITRDIDT